MVKRSESDSNFVGHSVLEEKRPSSIVEGRLLVFYSYILVIEPAPTVRPPSRMANLEPTSIAIG